MIPFFKKNKVNILTFLSLLFLVFIFFYPTLHLGFFSDDYHFLYVTATQDSVWKYLFLNNIGEFNGHYPYGPILNFIFTAEYNLFALNAFFYHFVTLSVYTLTAFFLYLFVKNISKNNLLAFFTALLFIFVQNHTSSVAWVAVKPHLWATFFLVIFLYFYHYFLISKKNIFYILALLAIIFSIFTKESAITFPAILILFELFFVKNENLWSTTWRIFKRIIPFLFVLFSYLVIRFSILGYILGYYGSSNLSFNIVPKLKMFVDIVLSMFVASPYRQIFAQFILDNYYLFFILFVFFLLSIWWLSKKNKNNILIFSLLSFCFSTLPFLNVKFEKISDEGERYAYLPSVFFVIFLSYFLWFIFYNLKKQKIFYVVSIISIACLSAFFHINKIKDWQKSAILRENILLDFAKNLDKNKNNYFLFLGLPDNFEGTQLMRNAILEMFKLENNFFAMNGERITFFTAPKNTHFQEKFVDIVYNDNSIILQAENNVSENIFSYFGGTKHGNDFLNVEITKADINKSSNHSVEIFPNYNKIESSFYDLSLVYFDGKNLKFIDLKNNFYEK